MERRPGRLKVGTLRGTPVYIHWSFPAGGLVLSLFAGFGPLDSLCYCLAFVLLIALHELGHFVAARHVGLKVVAVDITGFGGECRVQMPRSARDIFLVFSAGLLAQVALLAVTIAALAIFGAPRSPLGKALANTFTYYNAFLLVVNLIPGKTMQGISNDGEVLWKLYLHVKRGEAHPFPDPFAATRVFPPEIRLLGIDELRPKRFTTGLEILNDETTPMDFVVSVLTRHLQLERDEAIRLMLAIHKHGGQLIPTASLETAEAMASAIAAESREQGHKFVCRAVDARGA